jgi:hypothetical protein
MTTGIDQQRIKFVTCRNAQAQTGLLLKPLSLGRGEQGTLSVCTNAEGVLLNRLTSDSFTRLQYSKVAAARFSVFGNV